MAYISNRSPAVKFKNIYTLVKQTWWAYPFVKQGALQKYALIHTAVHLQHSWVHLSIRLKESVEESSPGIEVGKSATSCQNLRITWVRIHVGLDFGISCNGQFLNS